ncbi:unnamed protein product [Effrenium voratum]|nr:unnamed protein product [Effrenium voratum]
MFWVVVLLLASVHAQTCNSTECEDSALLSLRSGPRSRRSLLSRRARLDGSDCAYCMCLETDAVKCGEQMVTSAEECGEDTVTSAEQCGQKWVTSEERCGTKVVTSASACGEKSVKSASQCGTSLTKVCKAKKNIHVSCGWKKVAKSCKVPNSCSVPASCYVPNTCTVPKSCLQALTCWLPVGFLECADVLGDELPKSVKGDWKKYVTSSCSSLTGCSKKAAHGMADVVQDGWDWMRNGFGKAWDEGSEKVLGGIDTFEAMIEKLDLEKSVVMVKQELLDLMHDVEDAIDQLADGPIQLANRPDGQLCPAALGDDKLFGVFPTDCGVFDEMSELLTPLPTSSSDLSYLTDNKADVFEKALARAKQCLLLSGPWKWKGVSMPHPFWDLGKKDLCLSKSLVDALDVVVNLIYKGGNAAYNLFDTIANKVTDWTNKNLLSDLSLLSLEQRRSLPLILTQKAKCVKGTKDWSMKVKFTGKYSFAVLIGTSKIIWSFGLGAGVVFGCQNETYRTYPVIDIAHPFLAMFAFTETEATTDFSASGGLALSAKAFFTQFSSFTGPYSGSVNLGLKVAAKNLPLPCPPEVKCSAKRSFSLLKIPSGELIELSDTDDLLNMLVYQQELEFAGKYDDVSGWFTSSGLLQGDFRSDPHLPTRLVLGALHHLAASEIQVPKAVLDAGVHATHEPVSLSELQSAQARLSTGRRPLFRWFRRAICLALFFDFVFLGRVAGGFSVFQGKDKPKRGLKASRSTTGPFFWIEFEGKAKRNVELEGLSDPELESERRNRRNLRSSSRGLWALQPPGASAWVLGRSCAAEAEVGRADVQAARGHFWRV